MPKPSNAIKVGILVHEQAPIGLTVLARDTFDFANNLLGRKKYYTEFFSYKRRSIEFNGLTLQAQKMSADYDFVLVSPIQGANEHHFTELENELQILKNLNSEKTVIASACLGTILLAEAGLLNGREATTHWDAEGFVKKRYPSVKWNMQKMICDSTSVVTSGGYLALIDLVLSIIARTSGKKFSQSLSKYMLAESARENQSVYASALIVTNSDNQEFRKLEKWIDQSLDKEISVVDMANYCGMSLRNFQRQFISAYGFPPKRLLQLKRVQKAKALLTNKNLSMDEILEQIGVIDLSAFRKVFQRELGMTLSEYRRRN